MRRRHIGTFRPDQPEPPESAFGSTASTGWSPRWRSLASPVTPATRATAACRQVFTATAGRFGCPATLFQVVSFPAGHRLGSSTTLHIAHFRHHAVRQTRLQPSSIRHASEPSRPRRRPPVAQKQANTVQFQASMCASIRNAAEWILTVNFEMPLDTAPLRDKPLRHSAGPSALSNFRAGRDHITLLRGRLTTGSRAD